MIVECVTAFSGEIADITRKHLSFFWHVPFSSAICFHVLYQYDDVVQRTGFIVESRIQFSFSLGFFLIHLQNYIPHLHARRFSCGDAGKTSPILNRLGIQGVKPGLYREIGEDPRSRLGFSAHEIATIMGHNPSRGNSIVRRSSFKA